LKILSSSATTLAVNERKVLVVPSEHKICTHRFCGLTPLNSFATASASNKVKHWFTPQHQIGILMFCRLKLVNSSATVSGSNIVRH